MADFKKQRRIQWGVNALILGITLLLLILAFFIPGLQIVATVIGLSAVLAPLSMFGIGVIAAVVWNAAFALVSGLVARNEPNNVTLVENQSVNQATASPVASQTPTPSSTQAPKENANQSSHVSVFQESPKDNNADILQLATHVIHGEQAQAETMIQENPELLLKKCQVVDYSGRTIEGTPLQLALGAEDVKFHENEECMAEMIIRYLMPLRDGEKHKATQILEQFPEGWESQEKVRAEKDQEELKKVLQGIDQSKTNEEAELFLKNWEDYLVKQKEGILRTGKHANTQLVAKALELYEENYEKFGRYGSSKNNLAWRRVIGRAQRDLPANYAQAFSQKIGEIVRGEFLSRSLSLRDADSAVFYPLDLDASSRLGVDYAVADDGSLRRVSGSAVMPQLAENFRNLYQTKNSNISKACVESKKFIESSPLHGVSL